MLSFVLAWVSSFPLLLIGGWTCDACPFNGARSDDGTRWAVIAKGTVEVLTAPNGLLKSAERVIHEYAVCVTFLHASVDFAVGDLDGVTIYTHVGDRLITTRVERKEWGPKRLLPIKDTILVLTGSGVVGRLDTRSGKVKGFLDPEQGIRSGCCSSDGQMIAFGLTNGEVAIATAEGKEVTRFQAHAKTVTSIGFLDKATLLTSGADGKVKTWSLPKPQQPKNVIDTKGYALCSHAVGGLVVVGLLDGRVCTYALDTGLLVSSLKLHDSDAHLLLAGVCPQLMLSVGNDRRVALLLVMSPK